MYVFLCFWKSFPFVSIGYHVVFPFSSQQIPIRLISTATLTSLQPAP